MKYRIWDLSYKAELQIILQKTSGSPTIYSYVCQHMRTCHHIFDKDYITNNIGSLLKGNSTITGAELDIPNEINDCHKNNPNGLQFGCVPIILVLCEGDVECSYTLTLKSNEDNILLTEK